MGALRADEEFQRRVLRADQIIESQGVINALIGEGLARGMAQYQGEIDDLDLPPRAPRPYAGETSSTGPEEL
jgi:hypothetical protein